MDSIVYFRWLINNWFKLVKSYIINGFIEVLSELGIKNLLRKHSTSIQKFFIFFINKILK